MLLFSSADYINFFKKKNHSGTLSECQTVWIQIRTYVVSVWVQTDCKGYQQTTKDVASKEKLLESIMSVSVA